MIRALEAGQRTLIETWKQHGSSGQHGDYFPFMSLWVAFNTLCYLGYSENAVMPCATIGFDSPGLGEPDTKLLTGSLARDGEGVRLELATPSGKSILIDIRDQYVESRIFNAFVEDYREKYKDWLQEDAFLVAVKQLRAALAHGNRHYVVNMALVQKYPGDGFDEKSYKKLSAHRVIVAFDAQDNLKQLKNVLYQIRCNTFHGAKRPGHEKDDKIVKAAHPVLEGILSRLLAESEHAAST